MQNDNHTISGHTAPAMAMAGKNEAERSFDFAVGSFMNCHIRAMSHLCDALEALADSLPHEVNHDLCRRIARTMTPMVEAAHRFEERVLFPTIKADILRSPVLNQTVERLQDEHREDEGFAEEITEKLTRLADGDAVDSNQLGYMLRGFFEGMRRHIACEKEFIFPLVEKAEQRFRVVS